MFLIHRPSTAEIDRFLDRSDGLPLSYGPAGIVRGTSEVGHLDEQVVRIGHGGADFDRARTAVEARFRRDSAAAMQRATAGREGRA